MVVNKEDGLVIHEVEMERKLHLETIAEIVGL
jgi:hypothetical protein